MCILDTALDRAHAIFNLHERLTSHFGDFVVKKTHIAMGGDIQKWKIDGQQLAYWP
jgi:hypothetical protein